MIDTLKQALRPGRDFLLILSGYVYDAYRACRYGGWTYTQRNDLRRRDYVAAKIYHSVEKGLAFRTRRKGSGWAAVDRFVEHIQHYGSAKTLHERIGCEVILKFLETEQGPAQKANRARRVLAPYAAEGRGGAETMTAARLREGRLDDPERFFGSRRSVRDFSPRVVERETVMRAAELAANTPRACNRQSWFTYHIDERSLIDKALSFQAGNRGFGHEVPYLVILATDQRAFDNANERNQHFIEGGMYSMALGLALHSLGLQTCCLNWSKLPADDRAIRKAIPIRPEHNIIMMLAVGYANDSINVCCSPRTPTEEYTTFIEPEARSAR
ncbi:nitroreductase family protein [Aurantimonas sp. E1-2-R+4]|uniref:nitroreductase family protein n=1 Tax=Aurantimonas sp. E1-2-R+4 TaxID=3113714 RepID=UPI002F93E49B